MVTENAGLLGGAIAIAVLLSKVIEHLVGLLVKRFEKKEEEVIPIVKLDPSVVAQLGEAAQSIHDMKNVMMKVDVDGTPLVYSSRTGLETLRTIAGAMQQLSSNQDRIAGTLEKLYEKFEMHDKQEQIERVKIESRLAGIESKFSNGQLVAVGG